MSTVLKRRLAITSEHGRHLVQLQRAAQHLNQSITLMAFTGDKMGGAEIGEQIALKKKMKEALESGPHVCVYLRKGDTQRRQS